MKKAIVTLCTNEHDPLGEVTHPRMKAYAKRMGADFIVIHDRHYPKVNVCYEKYQMGPMLERYERIAYLDTDVVVRDNAPSLFEVVSRGHWGGFDEYIFWETTHQGFKSNGKWSVKRQFEQFGLPDGWSWDGVFYLNAGVMVFDSSHREFFENPPVTDLPMWDQPWWSYKLKASGKPVCFLGPVFNCMLILRKEHDLILKDAYLAHCAGFGLPVSMKVDRVKKVLETWGCP